MQVEIVQINGKEYEINKQGVSVCLEIRSAFLWLIKNSQIPLDAEIPTEKFGELMAMGMYGDLVYRIKDIICKTVSKMTPKKYEDLEPDVVMQLFLKIYNFHVGEPDKKKDQPK